MTMSFLSSFIKALVLSLGIWGAGPNEKSLGHWGCALKGDLGSLLSVICSLAMMTVVFLPSNAPCHCILDHHRPQSKGPIDHVSKSPKLWSRSTFSFYKWIISSIRVMGTELWVTQGEILRRKGGQVQYLYILSTCTNLESTCFLLERLI